MSERERWIVYPLVFLALGAAIRDKIARAVVTDDLHCKRIYCQDLVAGGDVACYALRVVDPENEQSVLAGLESAQLRPAQGDEPSRRLGILKLNNQSVVVVLGIPVSGSTFAVPGPASQNVAPANSEPVDDAQAL